MKAKRFTQVKGMTLLKLAGARTQSVRLLARIVLHIPEVQTGSIDLDGRSTKAVGLPSPGNPLRSPLKNICFVDNSEGNANWLLLHHGEPENSLGFCGQDCGSNQAPAWATVWI
jgi:hypothetical protein